MGDNTLKTETHVVARLGGKLTLEVTFTPRGVRPRRMYSLAIKSVEADGCSPSVFVYHRAAAGAPMEDGSPRDEFVCVADALDEDEIPVNEPDLARGVPYYRVGAVELLFRNPDMMFETAHSIIKGISGD